MRRGTGILCSLRSTLSPSLTGLSCSGAFANEKDVELEKNRVHVDKPLLPLWPMRLLVQTFVGYRELPNHAERPLRRFWSGAIKCRLQENSYNTSCFVASRIVANRALLPFRVIGYNLSVVQLSPLCVSHQRSIAVGSDDAG